VRYDISDYGITIFRTWTYSSPLSPTKWYFLKNGRCAILHMHRLVIRIRVRRIEAPWLRTGKGCMITIILSSGSRLNVDGILLHHLCPCKVVIISIRMTKGCLVVRRCSLRHLLLIRGRRTWSDASCVASSVGRQDVGCFYKININVVIGLWLEGTI